MYPSWLTSIGRTTKQHSPVILSVAASAGVIATTILAVRATPKAMGSIGALKRLESEEQETTKQEIVKATWKFYVPAGLCGAATIACIIGAQKIGAKQNAALLAAYTLADRSFKEYKDAVLEEIGENKERKIRDAVAINQMENNPNREVIILEGSDVLCYETATGRYFRGNHEDIRRAANEVDSRVLHDMYASLNEFFLLIGLDQCALGDELGWNIDRRPEVIFTSHLSPNGDPCLAISYKDLPVRDYGKVF